MTSIEDLHHDYLLVTQMKIPIKRKIRLLGELFGETDNHWRVVGITNAALNVFIKNNFKRVPRMGINRSHQNNRAETYTYLIEHIMYDAQEWWDYYFDRDQTILATSSENMSNNFSEVYPIDWNDRLFRSVGFSWSYRQKVERPFLEELARKYGLA